MRNLRMTYQSVDFLLRLKLNNVADLRNSTGCYRPHPVMIIGDRMEGRSHEATPGNRRRNPVDFGRRAILLAGAQAAKGCNAAREIRGCRNVLRDRSQVHAGCSEEHTV